MKAEGVFLLDVDNTLLDNDRIILDLRVVVRAAVAAGGKAWTAPLLVGVAVLVAGAMSMAAGVGALVGGIP